MNCLYYCRFALKVICFLLEKELADQAYLEHLVLNSFLRVRLNTIGDIYLSKHRLEAPTFSLLDGYGLQGMAFGWTVPLHASSYATSTKASVPLRDKEFYGYVGVTGE